MVNAYPQAITHTLQQIDSVPTSSYVKNYTRERKVALVKLLEKWKGIKIDSVTYVKNNKVWVIKQCEEHGITKELYWSDYGMFKKAEKWQDPGIHIINPHIDKSQFDIDCPSDCGLCVDHESHTGLGNIVLTNRCDLTCWYCFFYAKEGEPI